MRMQKFLPEKIVFFIKIGDSITITTDKKTKKSLLECKLSILLSHRIKDLDFIIHVVKHHQINFGNQYSLPIPHDIDQCIEIERAEKELLRLGEIQCFLTKLHVIEDLKIENINWRELSLIMEAVNTGSIVNINLETGNIFNIYPKKISNINLLFLIEKIESSDSEFKIYDFFNHSMPISIRRENERVLTSGYIALEPNHYNEYSNINFSGLLQTFKDLVSQNPYIYEYANSCLLNLLLAYDNATTRKKIILKTAKELSEWILQDSKDVIAYEIKTINYLQVIKRERELILDEISQLVEIAESANDNNMYKVAVYLLLDNQKVAQIHFNKMTKEQQNLFKTYPLYKFWKNS